MPVAFGSRCNVRTLPSGFERFVTIQQTVLIRQVVRVGVDENSPIPRNPPRPDSVQVKSDIGQAVVCNRVVLFGRLGKLVYARDYTSEKRLHLLWSRIDAIQVNIVATHLGALPDGVALICDGVHQRESPEDALDDSVPLIEFASGFDRHDCVLSVARTETHHRMRQVRLRREWHDNEICLLYTSDAADDLLCVDLGGRRIIKKKNR